MERIARLQGLFVVEGAWRTRGIIIPRRPSLALTEDVACAAADVQPLRFRVSVVAAKAPSLLPLKLLLLLLVCVLRPHNAGSAFRGLSFSGGLLSPALCLQRSGLGCSGVGKRSSWWLQHTR